MNFGLIFGPLVLKPASSRICLRVPIFSASSTNSLTASLRFLRAFSFVPEVCALSSNIGESIVEELVIDSFQLKSEPAVGFYRYGQSARYSSRCHSRDDPSSVT